MSKPVSIVGSSKITRDVSEVIYDAIVSLLVKKYPDGLSDQEIDEFVKQCYKAKKTFRASRDRYESEKNLE
jgi:hypothetical protein